MKKVFEKLQSRDVLIFFSLSAICFFAIFLKMKGFGLYGDDWAAGTYVYKQSFVSVLKAWAQWRGELDNFRPLAIALPVLWYWGYKIFGLAGVYTVIAVIYFFMYFLAFKVLSKLTSDLVAYLATVIFILYPTNNFFGWQVAATYPLSLIFVFLAILLYWERRTFLVFLALWCSLFINEATIFIFALALFPKQQISWADFKPKIWQWLKMVVIVIFSYIIIRFLLEITGLVKGGRLASLAHHFSLISYITQFFKAIFVVLAFSWGLVGWKILYAIRPEHLVVGLITASITFFTFRYYFRKQLTVNIFPNPHWYFFMAGIILIFAGRYYGFFYVPSINILNLDSRYYFTSSIGGFVLAAGLIQLALTENFKKWRFSNAVMLIVIIFALGVFKYEVQLDYFKAWENAKNLWKQLLISVPSLQEGEVVIINNPSHPLGKLVDTSQALGDLRLLFPVIYGPNTFGVTSSAIQNEQNLNGKVCIDSAPLYQNFCTEENKVYFFSWDDAMLTAHGHSTYLKARSVKQQVPVNMLAELKK